MTIKTYPRPAAATGRLRAGANVSSRRLYGSVNATPPTVTPGERIVISGNAPEDANPGEWISLESEAFVSNVTTYGVPTVRAQVTVAGTYEVSAAIRPALKQATYAIVGRHNGRPLDTAAWIAVRPYSLIFASPWVASCGATITIIGKAPRTARAGEWLTLKSHAFSSRTTTDGVPSIRARILGDGTYAAAATLRADLTPMRYTVLGTYKGAPLDTVARITVR